MQNIYFAVLIDSETGEPDLYHPSEIYGSSKQEVFNILSADVPKEFIAGVYTKAEFNALIGNNTVQEQDGNAFMNQMIQTASEYAANTNIQNNHTMTLTDLQVEPINHDQRVSDEIKYFEDNGIKYKFSNGNLYKKVWIDLTVDDESLAEYRIVNANTKKPINNPKYRIEHLDWQLIK